MNPSTRLSKIKLKTTPRRVAIQFLEWMLNLHETRAPSPLMELLERIVSELEGILVRDEVIRQAEAAFAEVYFLVALYTDVAGSLVEEISLSWQLNTFVLAFRYCDNPHNTELAKLLTDKHNRFSTLLAAIDQIEREYLGASVLPASLRELVVEEQALCERLRELISDVEPPPFLDTTACISEANQFMTATVRHARKVARKATSQSLYRGLHAFLRLYDFMIVQRRSCGECIKVLQDHNQAATDALRERMKSLFENLPADLEEILIEYGVT